jgi:hypothetical protein
MRTKGEATMGTLRQLRCARAAPAICLAAALLVGACGTTHESAPATSPSAPTLISPDLPASSAAPGRGGGRPSAGARGLPADWPPDLPVPPGDIVGATGSAGHWSVQVLVAGSADQAHRSAVALYTAAGFTAATDSVLNKGNRQITLVVENRDHSNAQTNLVIAVSTR